MLEFEILQKLEPNAEILEIIKDYEYIVENGKIKHLKATIPLWIIVIKFL